jgi:uncharacterized phage-associated protein
MHDSRVVANYMLDQAERLNLCVSNLALQKLLYFAHAISLVERKLPLVSGYFEAWQYGPAHPTVYQSFKSSGAKPITFRARALNPVTRVESALPNLNDSEAKRICDRVISRLGRVSPGQLVDITHADGGPWHSVVNNAKTESNLGLRIPDRVIAERHAKLKVSVSSSPKTGEPDEDAPFVGNRSC